MRPGEAPVVVQNTSTQKSLQVGVGILAAAAAIALLYFGRVFFITVIIAAMIAFLLDPLVVILHEAAHAARPGQFRGVQHRAGGVVSGGPGTVSAKPADRRRPAGLRRAHQRNGGFRRHPHGGHRERDLPQRGAAALPAADRAAPAPPPDSAARGKKKKVETPIILPPILPPAVQEVHIQQEPTPIFVYAYTYLAEYYSVLLMASFVPFLVYFLLSWRDHIRARYLLIFEGENRQAAAAAWGGLGDMVRAYVIGNFMLGLLLSVASALLFASVKLPYWLIVAPMSGFLSLVPYIGLPLALMPPVVAALPASKEPAMYLFLTVSVAMLHLLALNLLYPKFVGARVHLNPLAVTVALMFWGMLWGALGLVLAIPLTAAIKALCDHVPSMQPYGRLLGD